MIKLPKRKAAEPGLAGTIIPRAENRRVDDRCEPRHQGVVDGATLHFRGQDLPAKVVNLSSRGAMLEIELYPRIGERVLIQFPECSRMEGYVRWVRDGRLGINFGYVMTLIR